VVVRTVVAPLLSVVECGVGGFVRVVICLWCCSCGVVLVVFLCVWLVSLDTVLIIDVNYLRRCARLFAEQASVSRLTVQVVIYSPNRRETPEGISGNASHPGYRVDKQCTRDPQRIDIFSWQKEIPEGTLGTASHTAFVAIEAEGGASQRDAL